LSALVDTQRLSLAADLAKLIEGAGSLNGELAYCYKTGNRLVSKGFDRAGSEG
jgi:hypothetical protein